MDFIKNLQDVDALLCLLTDTIDREVIEKAGDRLKIIANYAVGYNNIDLKAAKERTIVVTNTSKSNAYGVFKRSTSCLKIFNLC